jgi:hypothetical protein
MDRYTILTQRKRAVIALVHSLAFGLLAAYQLLSGQRPDALIAAERGHIAGPLAMTAIYSVVSSVLWVLTKFSRGWLERLYFGFCATSASVGLLRVIFGDPTLHFGSLFRVLMLGCAVITGLLIVRDHTTTARFAD